MTAEQIMKAASHPNLVRAVEGMEIAMDSGKKARRLVATAAALQLRKQQGFAERVMKTVEEIE